MTVGVTWADIAHEFEYDSGALLDLYVQATTADDWQRAIDVIRSRFEQVQFLVDGEVAALPATVDQVFALKTRSSPSLGFTVKGVRGTDPHLRPDVAICRLPRIDVS